VFDIRNWLLMALEDAVDPVSSRRLRQLLQAKHPNVGKRPILAVLRELRDEGLVDAVTSKEGSGWVFTGDRALCSNGPLPTEVLLRRRALTRHAYHAAEERADIAEEKMAEVRRELECLSTYWHANLYTRRCASELDSVIDHLFGEEE
jgi:hypothetical protein